MSTLSASIQANTSGFKSAVEKAKKELELFDKSNKNLAQTMKTVSGVTDTQVNAFKKSVESLERATNGTKTYKQSAAMLEKELQKLNQQWQNLSDKAKQSEFGRYMSQSISETKNKLSELNAEMPKASKSWTDIAGQMNVAGVNVGDLVGKFKTLNPAIVGVAGSAKVMTDAFMSSETAMDNAKRTMSGLQNMYDSFVRSVRDGGLDMSNLFGAYGRGKELYDAEDAYGSLMANNKAVYERIQADIAEAREKITEGGTADISGLKSRVASQYSEMITSQKDIFDKEINKLANGNGDKKTLIESFVFGANPNATLDRMKEEAKNLKKEMADIWTKGTSIESEEIVWQDGALQREYERLDVKKKTLQSIIDSETELQKIVETQTQLNALETARNNQLQQLSKMQNKMDSQEAKKLADKKKAEEDYLKLLQKEREANNKIIDDTDRALSKSMKGRTTSLTTTSSAPGSVDTSALNNIGFGADQKKMKAQLDQQKAVLNYMQLEVSAVNQLAGAWSSLWGVIADGNDSVSQTMSAMGAAVQNFGNMFMQLEKIQFAAAEAGSLAKGTESAAALPFPYNLAAIGTVVTSILATFSSFKSIGKFAEGGVIQGASSIGDYNIARVNSGEMILNGSQQKNLFSMLDGRSNPSNSGGISNVRFRIEGKDLVGVMDTYNKRQSRVR